MSTNRTTPLTFACTFADGEKVNVLVPEGDVLYRGAVSCDTGRIRKAIEEKTGHPKNRLMLISPEGTNIKKNWFSPEEGADLAVPRPIHVIVKPEPAQRMFRVKVGQLSVVVNIQMPDEDTEERVKLLFAMTESPSDEDLKADDSLDVKVHEDVHSLLPVAGQGRFLQLEIKTYLIEMDADNDFNEDFDERTLVQVSVLYIASTNTWVLHSYTGPEYFPAQTFNVEDVTMADLTTVTTTKPLEF